MRSRVVVAVALLVVALGCSAEPDGRSDGQAEAERVFVESDHGLTSLRGDGGVGEVALDDAMPAADWSVLYRTAPGTGGVLLEALDPRDGRVLSRTPVEVPDLAVRSVSQDGEVVALGPPRPDDGGYPAGRSSTALVVHGLGEKPRRYDLTGNFEPEAFSEDHTTLFLVEYAPAEAPEQYRVRRLDLASGEVLDVYSRDKELQEAMRGSARTQVTSADGTRLYTLYQVERLGSAFVHVLDLEEQWAHCVDLPPPFGESSGFATALAVAPDGDHLYAADGDSGVLAEVDTRDLAVSRTAEIDSLGGAAATHAAVSAEGMLYVGSGELVTAVDTERLERETLWGLDDDVGGLRLGPSGARLYVAFPDAVAALDPATGHELERWLLPGVRGLSVFGGAPPSPAAARPPSDYQCAC